MLSSATIRRLIETQDLVTGIPDIESALQQNGIDLSVRSISRIVPTTLPVVISESQRTAPNVEPVELREADDGPYFSLLPNRSYIVVLNERVKIPDNMAALARPRSSFIRQGINIHTAVWDSSYEGNSSVLLRTSDSLVRVGLNTRIIQMVFFELDQRTNAYNGIYQNEG